MTVRPERDIPRFDCADPTDCLSCGEGDPVDECLNSKRVCGHHCGHVWTHDSCCWCVALTGDVEHHEAHASGVHYGARRK